VTPTRLRLLLAVALVTGIVTWAVLRVLAVWRGGYPDVGWPTPVTVALLAGAMFVTVFTVRPRLRRRPGAKPLPPLVAARFAALALASSRAGAAIAGGYLGFIAALAGELDTDYGRERAIYAGLTVVASVALVVAALLLERACRLPDDDGAGGAGPGGGGGLGSAA
jgi:hypothetical protein